MHTFTDTGVNTHAIPSDAHPISGVATSVAAFVGWAAQGPTNQAVLVQNFAEFQNRFGGLDPRSYLGYAVQQFFANGGQQAYIVRVAWDDGSVLTPLDGVNGDGNFEIALGLDPTATGNHFGVGLLDRISTFNLLCVPGETDSHTIARLQTYCVGRRAFYIVDCPQDATTSSLAAGPVGSHSTDSLTQQDSMNSAYYFPWVQAPDLMSGNRPRLFPPSGIVAGVYAATDAVRGVWKAPASIDAGLTGASGLQYILTDEEDGQLSAQAINCLRKFKDHGIVLWGARTLQGNDQASSQWKYVNVRRFALYLESSLYEGTQWAVFEPSNETLWGQIRLSVASFMQGLFRQGALQGTTPEQAYFVKCDSDNNPQTSIDQGIVNILVGFAPLAPAEFVVIRIQQIAGQG